MHLFAYTDFLIVVGFFALTPLFYYLQNRKAAIGGGVSFIKSAWLVYVICLWYIIPLLQLQTDSIINKYYIVFLISVILRAVVEGVLCYITHTWRVLYGIFFDILHLIIAGFAIYHLVSITEEIDRVTFFLFLNKFSNIIFFMLLCLSLFAELIFVNWFVKVTGGPARGYYFVPNRPEFRWVHRGTLFLFLPQFIIFWLWFLFR